VLVQGVDVQRGSTNSTIANRNPIQALAPAKNVGNAMDGISITPSGNKCTASGSQRSGLNSPASGPHRDVLVMMCAMGTKIPVFLAILQKVISQQWGHAEVGIHEPIEHVETHNISVFLIPFRSIIGSARGITQSSVAVRLVPTTGA
jgi:hypothetical protein